MPTACQQESCDDCTEDVGVSFNRQGRAGSKSSRPIQPAKSARRIAPSSLHAGNQRVTTRRSMSRRRNERQTAEQAGCTRDRNAEGKPRSIPARRTWKSEARIGNGGGHRRVGLCHLVEHRVFRGQGMCEKQTFTRQELYELVWKTPMRRLARQFGLSDVGLAKTCQRHNIPKPPPGYWAKKRHGKIVRRRSLPPCDDPALATITICPRSTTG